MGELNSLLTVVSIWLFIHSDVIYIFVRLIDSFDKTHY